MASPSSNLPNASIYVKANWTTNEENAQDYNLATFACLESCRQLVSAAQDVYYKRSLIAVYSDLSINQLYSNQYIGQPCKNIRTA